MQGDSECRAVKFYSPRDSGLNLLLFSERTDQVQVVDIASGFKRKQILAGTAPLLPPLVPFRQLSIFLLILLPLSQIILFFFQH